VANKTKKQLIEELEEARARIIELETSEEERKRAEEALEKAYGEIEKQVEERTAELKREIAERKRAEEALTEERKLLRTVIDSLPDYIFVKDRESRFVINNEAHVRVLKATTQDKVVGKTDFDIFPPELANQYYADEQGIMRTGQPLINRLEACIDAEGKDQWLLTTKVPLRDSHGNTVGLVGVSRDITAQKEAEAERERLQQEVIEAQKRAVQELSTPIIPIMERIIVMPLIGGIDTLRAKDIMRALLGGIRQHRARVVILDVTGVPIVDSGVANHLNKTIQAARLKGAQTIITGISDAVAEAIVDLGIDWGGVETLADLQTGLRVALSSLGIRLTK
jgi:rsbT co-antagonist protein RsbR